MFWTLISLGTLALIMYVTGLHQRIARIGGYGSVLPFNGFACGVADAYASGYGHGEGLKRALILVLSVMGVGAFINALIVFVVAML